MPLSDLSELAEGGGSLPLYIQRKFRFVRISQARMFLTQEERKILPALDDKDFDSFIDVLLQEAPAAGEICWMNRQWYMKQMYLLRNLFSGSE